MAETKLAEAEAELALLSAKVEELIGNTETERAMMREKEEDLRSQLVEAEEMSALVNRKLV